MKSIHWLTLAILLLFLVGCSKPEIKEEPYKNVCYSWYGEYGDMYNRVEILQAIDECNADNTTLCYLEFADAYNSSITDYYLELKVINHTYLDSSDYLIGNVSENTYYIEHIWLNCSEYIKVYQVNP